MTPGTIKVLRHSGERTDTPAEIYGNLAIHESLSFPGRYSVTHVPTGMNIRNNLVKSVADKMVVRLNELTVDWSFTDPQQAQLIGHVVLPMIQRVINEPIEQPTH